MDLTLLMALQLLLLIFQPLLFLWNDCWSCLKNLSREAF